MGCHRVDAKFDIRSGWSSAHGNILHARPELRYTAVQRMFIFIPAAVVVVGVLVACVIVFHRAVPLTQTSSA